MNYINHYKFICKGLFKTRSNNQLDFFRSRNQNGHSILVVIRFCQQYLDDFAIQGQEIRKHFGRNGDPRSVTYQQADKAVRRKTKTKLLKLAWQVWQLIRYFCSDTFFVQKISFDQLSFLHIILSSHFSVHFNHGGISREFAKRKKI